MWGCVVRMAKTWVVVLKIVNHPVTPDPKLCKRARVTKSLSVVSRQCQLAILKMLSNKHACTKMLRCYFLSNIPEPFERGSH